MTCIPVVGGYKCEQDKIITFVSPSDPVNPLISHQWNINGVLESTAASFQKTYTSTGLHTVSHSGDNACGGTCLQTAQLEIAAEIITPPATTAAATPSAMPMILGGVIAIAFLGMMISKKK